MIDLGFVLTGQGFFVRLRTGTAVVRGTIITPFNASRLHMHSGSAKHIVETNFLIVETTRLTS